MDKKVYCTDCDHYIGGRVIQECNYGPVSYVLGRRDSVFASLKNAKGDCKDFTPRKKGIIAWFNRIFGQQI